MPAEYQFPDTSKNITLCHGIAMTADEKEIWVVDQHKPGLHVFDVSGLPAKAPVWKQYIPTKKGKEKDEAGQTLYGEAGIFGQPGWIMASIDGRYFYPETGEIINTRTKEIVGHLKGANGKLTHSRFALEIDFENGQPVRCGDQFAVGRVVK